MLRRNDSQDEDSEDDIRWALIKRARQSGVPHQRLQDWMEQNVNGQGLIEPTTSTLVVDPPALQYDKSDNSSHEESQSEETVETVGTEYEEDPLAAENWSDVESDSMQLPDDGSNADDMTAPNDDCQVDPIGLSLHIDETFSQSIAAVNSQMSRKDKLNLFVLATLSSRSTRATFNALGHIPDFPRGCEIFKSQDRVHRALERESQVRVKHYDMCRNECLLFAGIYEDWTNNQLCSLCRAPRIREGSWRFTHISLIDRLNALWNDAATSARLDYRCVNGFDPGVIQDVYDGEHYKSLLGQNVRWMGEELGHKYFQSPHDLVLGFATDGVPLFKRGSMDVWPLVVTVYSLPPELRWLRPFQICTGLIPGGNSPKDQKRPKDFDSFLIPLMEELRILACEGASTYRAMSEEPFGPIHYRAHVIMVSGDMPAISKLMNFKGHNAIYPCRCCTMRAIRVPPKGAYYLTVAKATAAGNPNYAQLPLRTNEMVQETVDRIEYHAEYGLDRATLQKDSGINGESRLSVIESLDFPRSFPLDLMHVLFENIMPQLLSMWEGNYKAAMITGQKNGKLKADFVIPKSAWQAINKDLLDSNATIPSQIARKVGSITARGYWTADTYAHFMMFLGPIVLKGRLPEVYFKHFVSLSELAKQLVSLEIPRDQLDKIEKGLIAWVKGFEKLYYRYDAKYRSFCTAPIHSLLHVVSYIRWQGPPCQYWCFAMERYGGWVKAMATDNRKKAVIALANRVIKEERILQFMKKCDPRDLPRLVEWQNRLEGKPAGTLSPYHLRHRNFKTHHPDFKPSKVFDEDTSGAPLSESVLIAIQAHLQTRGYTDEVTIQGGKYVIPMEVIESIDFRSWRAFDASTDRGAYRYRAKDSLREQTSEARNNSWIMYYQMVCKNPTIMRRPAVWAMEKQWGQVERFLTFQWPNDEGDNEEVHVAVIQSWSVEEWIVSPKVREGPQVLKREDGKLLQVVDVHFLGGCAGRVIIEDSSGAKKEVIFEKTIDGGGVGKSLERRRTTAMMLETNRRRIHILNAELRPTPPDIIKWVLFESGQKLFYEIRSLPTVACEKAQAVHDSTIMLWLEKRSTTKRSHPGQLEVIRRPSCHLLRNGRSDGCGSGPYIMADKEPGYDEICTRLKQGPGKCAQAVAIERWNNDRPQGH